MYDSPPPRNLFTPSTHLAVQIAHKSSRTLARRQPRRLRYTKPRRNKNSRHMRHLYVRSNQLGIPDSTPTLVVCSTQGTPKASRPPWTRTRTLNWPRYLNSSIRTRMQWSRSCLIGSPSSSQNCTVTSRRLRHRSLVGYFYDFLHDTSATSTTCKVLITLNETPS